MADTTRDPWNILVVDDDEDIHTVTQLALKRQQWRGRSFAITRADSARQARQILGESPPSKFHVALVDVVMETDSAGLELCDYIRSKSPLSLRIILRTGQAGVAPEERVVEEFEIDHYLAKVDATADRIRALVVASIRSSMDVRMLLALREQLESFAGAMQGTQSVSELDQMLARALEVLEWKYRARASFYPNLDVADAQQGEGGDTAAHRSALRAAQKAGVPARTMHGASRFGLSTDGALLWFDSIAAGSAATDPGLWGKMKRLMGGALPEGPRPFGLVIEPGRDLGPKAREMLERDVGPFLDNWAMAQRILSLQEGAASVRAAQILATSTEP